jgi:hypothetical protein
VLDAATLMRVLALSRTHFYRLVSDGVIPKTATKNQFELIAAVQGYIDYVKRGAEGSETVAAQRLELTAAQTAAIVQRTRARGGELVEAQEVKVVFAAVCVLLAGQLDAGPGRLLAAVVSIMGSVGEAERAKLHEVMRNEFRRIRESCAAELAAFGSDLRRRESRAAAAQANGGRVGRSEP